MKILSGSYQADEGEVLVEGDVMNAASPADALELGIGLVAQEVAVQPHLSVAENVLFGRMPHNRLGLIDWSAASRRATEALDNLHLTLDPRERLGNLPLHHQHLVSIAKMLYRRPRLLILDEPSASLPAEHVDTLFAALDQLRAEGRSVIYISHRLREYFRLCSRLVVLRDGVKVAERQAAETDEDQLVQLMVGRQLSSIFVRPDKPRPPERDDPPILRVRGLCTARKLRDIDLEVRRGEIVGIAGQAGSGRSTLARTLFGAQPTSAGTIEIDGAPVRMRSPTDAISRGVGFVPDDRKGAGLVLSSSVAENITMPSWRRTSRMGFRSATRDDDIVVRAVRELRIRTPSARVQALTLSGGNQQKIVIAKWVFRNSRLLILDEPTRGIDVGAKDELYSLIDRMAADGLGVLVLSSELLELLRLADRILVMGEGRVLGEQRGDVATEESITAMAFTGTHRAQETP